MTQSLGLFAPRRPGKLLAPLQTMVLNGVHDRLAGRVFVLQVGARDGQTNDPFRARFASDGWSGLLIEPHPVHFSALAALHKDSERVAVLNLGIASQSGTQPIYAVPETAAPRYPRKLHLAASLTRERIEAAARAALPDATPDDVTPTDVPLLRMDTVLRELGIDRVDVVAINAGGHELDVLSSFALADLGATAVIVHCTGASLPHEPAYVAALEAAGLLVFRIGDDLVGMHPGGLRVPLEDLLTFFGKRVGQEEDVDATSDA